MNVLLQPLSVFFAAAQKGLWPLRRLGEMGTPDDPRYFAKGDTVPWWIECRWPLSLVVKFGRDCETYFEDGWQVVRPLWDGDGFMMKVDYADHDHRPDILIVGAPTRIEAAPRSRRPSRSRQLTPCLA